MLQAVHEGRKDLTAKIEDHPLEHDLTNNREIIEKIQEQVKEITQEYEDFKVNIIGYTISSSWRGSSAIHKIVLGAYWQEVLG